MSKFNQYLEMAQNQLYVEAGLSRLYEHNRKYGVAMLSAWASPDKFKKSDGTLDELAFKESNNRAVKQMNIKFEIHGITHIRTQGQYGNFEHSEFAPFISPDERSAEYEKWSVARSPRTWDNFKQTIIDIASDPIIDQESILFKDPDSENGYLYFCKDSSWTHHKKGETMKLGKLHFSSRSELNRIFHELRKKAEDKGEDPNSVDAPQYSQVRHGNKETVFRYGDNKYGEMFEDVESEVIYPMSQKEYNMLGGFSRYARDFKFQMDNYGLEALKKRREE